MDAQKCARHCKNEPHCKYFAVKPKATCSRYNERAGECVVVADQTHDLYKKIGRYTIHISLKVEFNPFLASHETLIGTYFSHIWHTTIYIVYTIA